MKIHFKSILSCFGEYRYLQIFFFSVRKYYDVLTAPEEAEIYKVRVQATCNIVSFCFSLDSASSIQSSKATSFLHRQEKAGGTWADTSGTTSPGAFVSLLAPQRCRSGKGSGHIVTGCAEPDASPLLSLLTLTSLPSPL